jgi:hypothetical protein
MSGVQFLAGARNIFPVHSIQTGSGDRQASYSMGTQGSPTVGGGGEVVGA